MKRINYPHLSSTVLLYPAQLWSKMSPWDKQIFPLITSNTPACPVGLLRSAPAKQHTQVWSAPCKAGRTGSGVKVQQGLLCWTQLLPGLIPFYPLPASTPTSCSSSASWSISYLSWWPLVRVQCWRGSAWHTPGQCCLLSGCHKHASWHVCNPGQAWSKTNYPAFKLALPRPKNNGESA